MPSIATGVAAIVALFAASLRASPNLIANGSLEQTLNNKPAGLVLSGEARFGALGDPKRDDVTRGIWLLSDKPKAAVTADISGLDAKKGRWFRFTFRGLPQRDFAADDLAIQVSFFGGNGTVSYDAKEKKLFQQIQTARRDLEVNGRGKINGSQVWQSYQLDFMLPFPQVDEVKVSVGFEHGTAKAEANSAFLIDELSLVSIPEPAGTVQPATRPAAIVPSGKLIPLGGRWFYAAIANEAPPKRFDTSNAERLLYHDEIYSAPFAGNTSAWLRAGSLDANGDVAKFDTLINDNVTISFDAKSMIIHTHGVPNHPTGRFPEVGFGNPNSIQDKEATYYFPLSPTENSKHLTTDTENRNGALHMGPIGIAINGIVFFNPFDMGNTDATNLMDRCCGHPNQFNQYHYHKYPICVNTPWADEGEAHSPLIGWAFDGYPMYGPYEAANVMAKDKAGDRKLNAFNMHYDEARGWHYHVTPGQFPYLIGGFWGVEESRDQHHGGPPR